MTNAMRLIPILVCIVGSVFGNPPAERTAPVTTATAGSKGRSLLQVTTDSVSFSIVIATSETNKTQEAMLKANLIVEGFASTALPVFIPDKCPANSISPEGSISITQCTCLPGYEGNASAGANCVPCPIDTFCASGKLSPCPAHAHAPALSDSSMDCTCDAGFYGNGSVSCSVCPSNSFCAGGFAIEACVQNAVSPTQSTANTSCYCDGGFYGVNNNTCNLCTAGSWCWMGVQTSCPANSSSKPGASQISECVSLEEFLKTTRVQTITATPPPLNTTALVLEESTPVNQMITETQAIIMSNSANITALTSDKQVHNTQTVTANPDQTTNETQPVTASLSPTTTALLTSDEQANDTQTATANPDQTTNETQPVTASLSPTTTALLTSDKQENDTQTVTANPDQTTIEIKPITASLSPTVTASMQDQSTNEIKPSTVIINPSITASSLDHTPQTTTALISPAMSDPITTGIQRISTRYNPSTIQRTWDSTAPDKSPPSAGDAQMTSTSKSWQMRKTTTKQVDSNVTAQPHTTSASTANETGPAKQEELHRSSNNWPLFFSFLVVCMCVFASLTIAEQMMFHSVKFN